MNPSKRPRIKTGLVLPAMFGALTPARALTSYLRRHYHRRYVSRYRTPAPMFVFDMVLAGIATALIVWDVFLAVTPLPEAERLALLLKTGTVKTLAPVAMEAVIESHEAHDNSGLKLRWMLPADAEVLSAQPSLDANNEMTMPLLPAGKTVTARIIVRLHSPVGETLNIGFALRDDKGWMVGTGERTIAGSGVALHEMNHVIWAENTTPYEVTGLSINRGRSFDLPPFGMHVESMRYDAVQASLEYGGRLVATNELNRLIEREQIASLSLDPAIPGEPLSVHVRSRAPARLFVVHPGIHGGVASQDISEGQSVQKIPVAPLRTPISWFAWVADAEGAVTPFSEGVATSPFIPSVSVNYYLSSGDQVGVGPFPPVKGEVTRLWVEWNLAPITKTLNAISLQSILPRDVTFTGRVSLPDGGTLTESSGTLTWNLGTHEATANPLRARFEIELQPKTSAPATYQNTVHATAYDPEARITLATSTEAIVQH